jgi:hypothetical protein
VFLLGAIVGQTLAGDPNYVYPRKAIVSLMTNPGAGAHRLQRFYKGRPLEVLDADTSSFFVKVRGDGREGWIFKRHVSFDPPSEYLQTPEELGMDAAYARCDLNRNGIPDYLDIVHAARSFIGRYFDDFNKIGSKFGTYQAEVLESRWANEHERNGESAGPPPFPAKLQGEEEAIIPETSDVPDGIHWMWSMDGIDNNGDGRADDPLEEVMVCIDLLTAAYERAGQPVTRMLLERAGDTDLLRWSPGIWVSKIKPYYTRNIWSAVALLSRSPHFLYFKEPNIADARAKPVERFFPGDMIFFGRTQERNLSNFRIRHSAIVGQVDPKTGLPLTIITCIVPRVMEFGLERNYDRFTIMSHARPNVKNPPPIDASGEAARTDRAR